MDKFVRCPDPFTKRPVWIVPVCNPEGVLKYIRITDNAHSTLVAAEWVEHPITGDRFVTAVGLKTGLADKGWSLLADDFHADNWDTAWAKFQEWMLAGPMCREGGKVPNWPDKYLPSRVMLRRKRLAPHLAPPPEVSIPELDGLVDAAAEPSLRRRAA